MKPLRHALYALITLSIFCFASCGINDQSATSDSGVAKATIKVQTDQKGHTSEQNNYMGRVDRDNLIGSIKFVYIISAQTGDVLEFSTVVGKVTSGGKRLTPRTVVGNNGLAGVKNNYVTINGEQFLTDEVMDENGTYGESANYIYWFDTKNVYHQYFPSGGTYLHISDQPLRVRKANYTFTFDNEDTNNTTTSPPTTTLPVKK